MSGRLFLTILKLILYQVIAILCQFLWYVGLPRIKMYSSRAHLQADAHRWKCGGENNEATASFIKMTRDLIRAHKRCCLELSIACSYFLSCLRRNLRVSIGWRVAMWRIWSVDCSLTWLISSKHCWAFQLSQSRTKIIFWASCIERPISRPFLVRFCSGKAMSLSGRLL